MSFYIKIFYIWEEYATAKIVRPLRLRLELNQNKNQRKLKLIFLKLKLRLKLDIIFNTKLNHKKGNYNRGRKNGKTLLN